MASRIRGLAYVGPAIPESHLDLAECPPVAALTTVMPDGSPQTSVVWCDLVDGCLRVNTMRGFQKERNMRRNPRVTVLSYDPQRPYRYLEVRGLVEAMTEDGAARHLDALASKYAGRPIRYFGEAIPAGFDKAEIRSTPDAAGWGLGVARSSDPRRLRGVRQRDVVQAGSDRGERLGSGVRLHPVYHWGD